jgi:ATP-binding cassette subfamily B protein
VARPSHRSAFWRSLEGGRRRVVVLALASSISGLAEAAVLVLAVQVAVAASQATSHIALSIPGVPTLTVRAAVWIALVAALTVGGLHLVISRLAAQLSANVLRSVRARALRAYGRASWSRQARENEGALQESVSSLAGAGSLLILSAAHAFSAVLTLLAFIVGALLIDPAATVVVVIVGGVLFAVLRPLLAVTRRRSRSYVRANSAFNEGVAQLSSLAFELRTFGVDGREIERLVAESDDAARLNVGAQFANRVGLHLYRDVALVLLVGAIAVLEVVDTVDLAAVGSVLLLMLRSLGSAQDVNGAIHQVQHQLPNLEALDERLSSLEADTHPVGHVPIDRFEQIELREVTFRYEPEAAPALRDLDLTIRRGEMLGIVGPSGGGKSTLVQLLLRLRHPESGRILVDGVDLLDVGASSWQRLVSAVPQSAHLFPGTIRENIAFHRDVDDADVERAARMANIADEIAALPDGYDTQLGPRGAGLSGGQSQRLTIARALVGRPSLLILDEPTSALDVHSEAALQRTIDELAGEVTLVIIAHRLTTIAACDRLMILEQGSVAAIGTRDEVRDHPFLRDRMV